MASSFEFAPGVRTEEAAPVALPANVGPTLIGIVGKARRGRVDSPQPIPRWREYVRLYGGFSTGAADLGVYLREFFDNGGAGARCLRVAASDAVAASNTAGVLTRAGGSAFDVHA